MKFVRLGILRPLKKGYMNANEFTDSDGNVIRILGLTGLLLIYKGNEYYIDSELLSGNKSDLAIFSDRVGYYPESDKRVLSLEEKQNVLQKTLKILSENKIRIDVY